MNLPALEALKVFCDVVRQKSFSLGAAMNQISQSAASQSILQIEKHLGVRLIDRSKRPLGLTPEGEIYYKECRDLVDRYLGIESRIRTRQDELANRVNVASIYSLVLYNMNQYVEPFMKRHPKGGIRFRYLHPEDVYESVLNEQADLGLLSFPRSMREIQTIPWRNEPMALVCSPSHPFAALSEVSVKDLAGRNFVAFESGLGIRRSIDKFLREKSVEVNVVMAFDNIEAIKRAVETIGDLSILPEPTVRAEVKNGSLIVVPMPDLDLVRPLCLIHRNRRVLTPAMLSFVEILQHSEMGSNGALRNETG